MTIVTRGKGQWLVPSTTTVGKVYVVKQVNGQFSCDCDGSFYRGKCKHQDAVAAKLAPWRAEGFRVDPAIGLALLTGKTVRAS